MLFIMKECLCVCVYMFNISFKLNVQKEFGKFIWCLERDAGH